MSKSGSKSPKHNKPRSASMTKRTASVSGYTAWVARVPRHQREVLAQILRDNPVQDMRSLSTYCQQVIYALAIGDLHPEIANAMLDWAKLLYDIELEMGASPEVAMGALTQHLGGAFNARRLVVDNAKYGTPMLEVEVEPEVADG